MKTLIILISLLLIGSFVVEGLVSPTNLFGNVESAGDPSQVAIPMRQAIVDKRTIFRVFKVIDSSVNLTLGSYQVPPSSHVVAKYDAQLNDYVWAASISINEERLCWDSVVLPSCDGESVIVVFGVCYGFFPQFNTTGDAGSLIIKYDGTGQYVWHKKVNSSYGSTVASITCVESRDVFYVAGVFEQSIQLDNVTLTGDSNSAYVVKFDHNARVVWATNATGVQLTAMTVDEHSVYIAGALENANFGDSIGILGTHIFWCSLNRNSGEFLEVVPFATGSTKSSVTSISVGTHDTIYLSGFVFVNATLGNSTILGSKDYPSMFVMQYNRTNGDVVWTKSLFPEGLFHAAFSMIVDSKEELHTVGVFNCAAGLEDVFSCNTNTFSGYYAKLTNSGELLSFLSITGSVVEAVYLSGGNDGYMSVFGDGMGAMVHFQHGPTLNITDTVFIYLAEILEPKSEAFNVVPTERVTLNDDFQLSITDQLFSTYRFGFFDLKGERVFLNQWNDSRILNTTISATGNFTVFAQALTNHDQIVEWTSSIEVYQIEDPKNNTDNGNNGNNNNHGTSTSKKRKLKPYAIALIVLACVFIIIIALALVATLVAILCFRKRKSKQNAEEDKYNNKNDTEMEMRCETK